MRIKSLKHFIKFLPFCLLFSFLLQSCAARRAAPLQCNVYVINQMSKKNINLPNADANGLDRYMSSSSNWKKISRLSKNKLNHKEAHKLAKSGKIVIAAYNTRSKRSGHIAIVSGKKSLYWSNSFKTYVPHVDGSVNGKPAKITPLSQQFSPSKESNMNYFVYLKK